MDPKKAAPSTAVESMQLGGLAGLTALTMGIGQDGAKGHGKNVVIPPTNGERRAGAAQMTENKNVKLSVVP